MGLREWVPRCDWLVLVACAGGGGRLGEWHGRHVSSGCIGDETMHCFVRSIDFDALSGRVTWVPVICFGIRAICGRGRGSVEGWGRIVVRLGAVGGTKREDVAVGLGLAVRSTVKVGGCGVGDLAGSEGL